MTTLREVLNMIRTGVTNIVLFKDGYDGEIITPNEAFKKYSNILETSVISLEVADNNTIRIIL